MQSRLERLRRIMDQDNLDGMIIMVAENRRYLSGFKAENSLPDESAGALLVTSHRQILVTNSLYQEQARRQCPDWPVELAARSIEETLAGLIAKLELVRVGFESHGFTFRRYHRLDETLAMQNCSCRLEACNHLVEKLRLIKSGSEVAATEKALEIAEKAFINFLARLRPGMTEAEAAWQLEKAMRQLGAQATSFDTIVVAGPNSSLPHGQPGDRTIGPGEPVLCDWGARLEGYCSDTSRTIVLGQPDEKFLDVFNQVVKAQQTATAAIKPGVKAAAVDAAARDIIDSGPFKGGFSHGLGHGTGLAVHEEPRLSRLSTATLAQGMLVTVEPGIYLPDWGGVRLENQVLVTGKGARIINRLPVSWNPEDYRGLKI